MKIEKVRKSYVNMSCLSSSCKKASCLGGEEMLKIAARSNI